MITANWGAYDGPTPRIVLNSSRITAFLDCPERAYRSYIAPDVPVERPSPALSIGTYWHSACEQLDRGAIPEAVVTLIQERINLDAFNAEADGHLTFAKAIRDFSVFCEHAVPAYADTYKRDSPTGEHVASEQEFWVNIDGIVVLGRIDKVGLWNGLLVNAERKTIAEHEDIGDFLALRRNEVQHNLYELALIHADHTTLGLHPDVAVFGTVYDLTRKLPWPLKASSNGTVEVRREQWARSLFHTQPMPLSKPHQQATIATLHHVADHWGSRVRNLRSCRNFTNRACAHFDACLSGAVVPTQPRTPDYVDEVTP
jgi:hypothetical protein